MIDIKQIVRLQHDMVVRWHQQEVDNPSFGLMGLVCEQHGYNFRLWHQEDIARSPDVSDAKIAEVKRAIDKLNQKRNDAIEKIDDWLSDELISNDITADDAPLNTETPGSAIDRLSILSIRMYHLQEQIDRDDASHDHIEGVKRKLAVCLVQHRDLTQSLTELVSAIFAGEKRHRVYRQFKMYNDPTLNPYLYNRKKAG